MVARQAERDAQTRERARRARTAEPAATPAAASRREAARSCAWCGEPIEIKPTGRIPKWCSAACRQRAWEQARAAASGRAAVQVVERVIETPVERMRMPRHGDWPGVPRELAAQLDDGRIYARELAELDTALTALVTAMHRHPSYRRIARR